jgi:hypothetical protein
MKGDRSLGAGTWMPLILDSPVLEYSPRPISFPRHRELHVSIVVGQCILLTLTQLHRPTDLHPQHGRWESSHSATHQKPEISGALRGISEQARGRLMIDVYRAQLPNYQEAALDCGPRLTASRVLYMITAFTLFCFYWL